MTALAFNHVNMRAPRELLESLKGFYCDVVGLVVGKRPEVGIYGYWLCIGDQAVMHLAEAGAEENVPTDAPRTVDHLAFDCDDRAGTEQRLRDRGIEFRGGRAGMFPMTILFCKDPAGTAVELRFAETTQ
jgi:catechol 2,3-dioxygenase-like lactoylglutathione lyase family enzyme